MTSDRDADALSAHLVDIATRAATEAGSYVVEHAGRVAAADKAGFYDPVTECDRESERLIVERIFREHPDSTIVGEEGGRQGSGAVHWYVDPIDGTVNFVAGVPFFCVSIGAALGDRMLAGVIYDPVRREVMAASTAGATLDGEPMRSRGGAADTGATLLTDFPKSGGRAAPEDYEQLAELVASFRAVRRLGSSALHLAYGACGRADATFGLGTNAWDVAAGMFLVQQAGGRYFVPGGDSFAVDRPWLARNYLAACPELDLERSSLRRTVWNALFAPASVT